MCAASCYDVTVTQTERAADGRLTCPPTLLVHMLFTAWPTYWAGKLLLVRGLSSDTKPEDLQTVFPGAEEIIVTKDTTTTYPHVGKRRENAAVAKGFDG